MSDDFIFGHNVECDAVDRGGRSNTPDKYCGFRVHGRLRDERAGERLFSRHRGTR
jgi:hypothetical protein